MYFEDADGNPLPEHSVTATKKQQGDAIRDLIQQKCDEINAQIEALGEIHLYTPNPTSTPQFQIPRYQEPPPTKPIPGRPGLLARLFKRKRARHEAENAEKELQYEQAFQGLAGCKAAF